jgi:hypothetical protein
MPGCRHPVTGALQQQHTNLQHICVCSHKVRHRKLGSMFESASISCSAARFLEKNHCSAQITFGRELSVLIQNVVQCVDESNEMRLERCCVISGQVHIKVDSYTRKSVCGQVKYVLHESEGHACLLQLYKLFEYVLLYIAVCCIVREQPRAFSWSNTSVSAYRATAFELLLALEQVIEAVAHDHGTYANRYYCPGTDQVRIAGSHADCVDRVPFSARITALSLKEIPQQHRAHVSDVYNES